MSGNAAPGVIHDIGYQRYAGVRLGRGYAARSLCTYSLRAAYGLGRTAKAKILPLGLFTLACMAAVILVMVNTQSPAPVLSYVGLVSTFSYAATVFAAIVGPELVSRDLRNNVLALYLSRPVNRSDYALAKLAALAGAVFVLFAGPMLIMFVGMAFNTSDGLSGVLSEAGGLLAGLAAALIHASVFAALALPLAALTGRRMFGTGLIIAVFLILAPVSGVIGALDDGALGQLAGLLDPVSLVNGVDRWLFGEGLVRIGPYGAVYGLVALALTALGTAALLWRYRRVKV
ncbi:ABC-2 transporter permease [Actinophytocola sp.]|uniref:ABC-2 transporter permease n=1 Tax=Actinophytocola sp. TaxID=1872138 RepID=UPI002D802257|nr:ABC-2 transporter permease [Actinophytocola sp.]HET9139067.1 ABC-2 transporter permease [Actinophytocola sp.]